MPTQVPRLEIHDEQARIVKGFGTVDVFDEVNERLPIEEFKKIMPVIMDRGGIIMNKHTNQPVGKILNYEFRMKDTPEGPHEGVYLTTKVFKDFGSDDEIWEGIKKHRIQGFSFGGKNTLVDVDFSKGVEKKVLKGLEGFEFSYVDKGCNEEATIDEINYIAKENKGENEMINKNELQHFIKEEIKKEIDIYLNEDVLNKYMNNINKAKVFLKPGQEPPKGASVRTGPRGGRFFESGGGQPQEQPRQAQEVGDTNQKLSELSSIGNVNDFFSNETKDKLSNILFGKDFDSLDANGREEFSKENFQLTQDFWTNQKNKEKNEYSKLPVKTFTEEEVDNFRSQDIFPKSSVEYKGNRFFVSPISEGDTEDVGSTKIPISDERNGSRVGVVSIDELFPPRDFEVEKSLSKSDLTLLYSYNKGESFIKKRNLIKNMVEEENKKPTEEEKVDKVEEAPMAADSVPTQDPIVEMKEILMRILEAVSVNKVEEPNEVPAENELPIEKDEGDDHDHDEEEDKVEKEGDGEEVKLPESEGDEVSQDKPAEGAKTDESAANFLQKEGIEKMKADIKADIMKGLLDKKADTPRPGVVTNDIKKTEFSVPKTSIEANKMIKKAGLQ